MQRVSPPRPRIADAAPTVRGRGRSPLRHRARWRAPATAIRLAVALPLACGALLAPMGPSAAQGAVDSSAATQEQAASSETGVSLEAAASKAGSTGRKVAMSLIGLAFAVAGIVLAFRRDFKEAAGVFVVGLVAVLLASPAGIGLLQDTVNSLFGSR
jgi:hypothetical protein